MSNAAKSTVYRIQSVNGRFDHVATKAAALARAVEIAGAEPGTDERALAKDYGVTLKRVSQSTARSVGL